MSQQRLVQLSAASLALVFGIDEESSRTGLYNASGQDIFADFKAQNVRSFWNKRLVKAIAEIYFQGWMENLVLFVQGNANHLEVLREAWMRRALRSPKGFVIKAVGDLSPVQMLPVPQSQFIPLAEVLCSVISDMNASHVTVNQEALINHMSKAHPGMTIPTQDILYNALGTLIKERKIYHTGEGYFIVTPQTYFITDSLVREKSWWTSGPGVNDMPSPPPITYLLSNEACLEANAQPPLVAHCKSCSCFAPQPSSSTAPPAATAATPSNPDQHSVSVSVSDCTGKSLKWTRPSDHKPSVQNQSTSTAADYQASEVSKTTGTTAATSRKDKDYKDKPGRKFGLSLFRRNGGKRDKPKKEYASFSAQFPPEEWPVRDEDDLNNLPRDLEHAIIRRINPELTVDNLTRHTVLMKKLEERGERATVERERPADKGVDRGDRAVDKGMSTEILNSSKAKHHYSSRTGLGAGRRSVPKACRSKRRAHSSREKQRERDRERDKGKRKAPQCVNDDPEAEDLIPSHRRLEVPLNEPDLVGDAGEGRCLYKKRIDNPFQSTPGLDSAPTITTTNPCNRDQKREREPKEGKTGTGRTERGGHRSKSWDPHRARMTAAEAEHTGKSPVSEDRSYERLPERGLPADPLLRPSPKPDRELPADYGSAYPQSSTLRIEDKVKHQREGKNRGRESREGWERGEGKHQMLQEEEVRGRTNQRHPISQAQGEDHPDVPQPNTDMNPSLPATPYDVVSTHSYDPAWAKPSIQQRLSQRYADLEEANNRLPSYQKPCTTAGNQGTYNDSRSPKSSSTEERQITESHVFIGQRDGDHRRPYQRREEEEDACSSLCLSEEGGMNGRKVFKTGKVDCHELLSVYQDHDPDPQPLELPGHYQPSRHQPDSYFSYNHPHSLRRNWDSTYAMDSHSSTQQHAPQTSVRPEENSWSGGPIYHPQKTQSPDAKSNLNPRRAAPSLGESMHDASLSSDHPDHTEAADSSIFDYCQTSEVDSDAETLHKSADEGDGESVHWGGEAKEPEESFETQRERDIPQSPGASLNVVRGAQGGEAGETEAERERGESQSVTGDSGIDSPRTRVSLSSNNTVILEGLKRRGFLQNLEKLHSKSTAMRPQSSLLQLTPVMNV